MKRFIQQYCKPIALTIFLFLMILAIAVSANFPSFASWTQHIVARTPTNLTAAPIATINKPIQVAWAGSVESSPSVPINAEFSGFLSEVYVSEGQSVKSGQPLLKIQASSQPTSDSEVSTVSLANQRIGSPEQIQSNYENALKEFNRYQKLYEQGAIPRRQLDNAATRLQETKESLTNNQSSMSGSNVTAPLNGSATMSAPIDGIVTGLSTALGNAVEAEQQLMSLGSGQEMEVVVHLEQQDLYLVHLGTPATIELSHQTIAGQVSAIYPEVKESQISSFLAHIKLLNAPPGLLKLGMSITANIDIGKAATVAAVPTESIFQNDQGRNFIYIANNGKAILQPISLGDTIDDFTEITSDLPQQSMVITSNIKDIKDGDSIFIIQ